MALLVCAFTRAGKTFLVVYSHFWWHSPSTNKLNNVIKMWVLPRESEVFFGGEKVIQSAGNFCSCGLTKCFPSVQTHCSQSSDRCSWFTTTHSAPFTNTGGKNTNIITTYVLILEIPITSETFAHEGQCCSTCQLQKGTSALNVPHFFDWLRATVFILDGLQLHGWIKGGLIYA